MALFQHLMVMMQKEKQFINDTMRCILEANGDNKLEMITDMHYFNCCGNTNKSLFKVFWKAAACVLEMENGSGAHNRHHALADDETTNTVSFAPGIILVLQLWHATMKLLGDKKKVVNVNFKAPCLS
eukprot:12841761-Ditylum_brightwellii.AAC.2